MQILHENYLDDSTFVASSIKPNYPLDNVRNYHLSRKFKFNDTLGGSINIDLGASLLVTHICVAETNATTITVDAYDDDTYTTPVYSGVLTMCNNDWAGLTLNQTKRYWKLTLSGGDTISYLYMGQALQLPGINPEVELVYNNTGSVTTSVSLQSYGDTGINFFSSKFSFPIVTDYNREIDGKTVASREDILMFWYENQGVKPFILLVFEESLDRIPPMMALIAQSSLVFKLNRTHGYYSLDFSVIETK